MASTCSSRIHARRIGAVLLHPLRSFAAVASLPEPAFFNRRSAGGRAARDDGGPIIQFVTCCWPMAHRLLDQPVNHQTARRPQEHTVNMIGMNIIIRCCAGSPVVGVIFGCQNWCAHQHRRDEQRIVRREILDPPDERRAADLDRHRQHA